MYVHIYIYINLRFYFCIAGKLTSCERLSLKNIQTSIHISIKKRRHKASAKRGQTAHTYHGCKQHCLGTWNDSYLYTWGPPPTPLYYMYTDTMILHVSIDFLMIYNYILQLFRTHALDWKMACAGERASLVITWTSLGGAQSNSMRNRRPRRVLHVDKHIYLYIYIYIYILPTWCFV